MRLFLVVSERSTSIAFAEDVEQARKLVEDAKIQYPRFNDSDQIEDVLDITPEAGAAVAFHSHDKNDFCCDPDQGCELVPWSEHTYFGGKPDAALSS